MVERDVRNVEVRGSIPRGSTTPQETQEIDMGDGQGCAALVTPSAASQIVRLKNAVERACFNR